jgi:hypothetical protein
MMQDPDLSEQVARGRFMALQMMRLSGIALVVFGLLVINGKLSLPAIVGYVMLVVGVVDALVLPSVLARIWKSPPS